MTALTKPLEHDCTHPVTEHWISADDDRWHCNVVDCACSRLRLMPARQRGYQEAGQRMFDELGLER
jgi:hypothetical protein